MLTIPCAANGESHWTQRTELGGRDYVLTFDWNQRLGHFVLDLADQDGAPIATGLVLVTGWPLLRRVTDARRPLGELVVVDTTGRGEEPTYSGLGARWALFFFEPGDVG